MKVFLTDAEIVKIMMHYYNEEACRRATQAIVDQAERRYRCLCNFATKDHRRINHHRKACKVWLKDGERQWKAISGSDGTS